MKILLTKLLIMPLGFGLTKINRMTNYFLQNKSIRFIVLHSVNPISEYSYVPEDNISPTSFKNLLSLIRESSIKVVKMKDALFALEEKNNLNEKLLCITFDDGYLNNLTLALPILKEFGYPAHIFLSAGLIGRGEKYFHHAGFYKLGTMNLEKIGNNVHPGCMPLTYKQVKELVKNDISIGSHGVNHVRIKFLSTEERFYEIKKSKEILEDITNTEIITFAYPHGYYDDEIIQMVKKAGYRYGFGASIGRNNYKSNKYILNRCVTGVVNSSVLDMNIMITGGYDFIRFFDFLRKNHY
jgi:peptidoglycan/xylan/chitin deacetylase (PgdA/CDA1 family)